MARMACVDLPDLPLQILLREHPQWEGVPAAVVDRDKPQGQLLWVNDHARAQRILPGMRYAAALGLCRHLQVGTVEEQRIQSEVAALVQRFSLATPRVEASADEPGVFWLDASGFEFLYPSLRQWGEALRRGLRRERFDAAIVIGWTRFGTYAAARANRGVLVFDDEDQEQQTVKQVPLDRLQLAAQVRDRLNRLQVNTLGQFAALGEGGIRRRFGAEAQQLHQAARGQTWQPLRAEHIPEAIEFGHLFELPEVDAARIAVQLEAFLEQALDGMQRRRELLVQIFLHLLLDDGAEHSEVIQPAEPTLEFEQLSQLLRLRFESIQLSSGVVEMQLQIQATHEQTQQASLFAARPRRDPAALQRAFARLRAEFGNQCIAVAQLNDGHLPEAQYAWKAYQGMASAKVKDASQALLIRRLYTPPQGLPYRPRREPDGWLITGAADGPVEETRGPFVLSGGWWLRETARSYSYVRTRSGRWLWIYRDRHRGRWMLHGELE